jgi:hypothetical protein
MKTKIFGCSILLLYLFSLTAAVAQDLGAQFKKVEGRHLRLRRGAQRSQCHDRFDQDGVVLIDTGQSPKDSHVVMAAVKKLTSPSRCATSSILATPRPRHGRFCFLASSDRPCRVDRFDESLRVV